MQGPIGKAASAVKHNVVEPVVDAARGVKHSDTARAVGAAWCSCAADFLHDVVAAYTRTVAFFSPGLSHAGVAEA